MSGRTTTNAPAKGAASRGSKAVAAARRDQQGTRLLTWLIAGAVVILVLGVLYAVFRDSTASTAAGADSERYEVGSPGPGDEALPFTLPGTNGTDVALSDFAGEEVLLYLHEGLGCQPCWDQIRDLEAASPQLSRQPASTNW